MLSRFLIWVLIATLSLQSVVVHADALPFASTRDFSRLTEEESRGWNRGHEFDDVLRKNGSIYQDETVERYVQSVADRIYPEFMGSIKIRVLNDSRLNAFALPNGSIYLNLGMLARLENEAQLAAVLGHEIAHFTHRHSYQNQQGVKNAAAFAVSVALLGVPLFGDLLALSSIYGFSREKENEADNVGFARLIQAGYNPQEAVKVFEHLMAEAKALDAKEPFLFSSHPKLQERVDNYRVLITKSTVKGDIGQEVFLEKVRKLRLDNLENEINLNRFKSVLLMLSDEKRRAHYAPEAQYYLAEAYYRRGDDGDIKMAEQFYKKALMEAPQFIKSYRSLGVLCLKREDFTCAIPNFEQYLKSAPDAKDAAYVRQYLELAIKRINKI